MATYTNSSRFSVGGVGSVLVPERWVPALESDLPLYRFWDQFMGKTWGEVQIINQGEGRVFKVSYLTDKDPATTPLTAGTTIVTTSSTGVSQASGTLNEYGDAERIENFHDWITSTDDQVAAAVKAARQAAQTRNSLIGAIYLGSGNYFTIEGTTAADVEETSGTTANGTSTLLPLHVTAIVGNLRRKGIGEFADGYFRCIGAPGMFDGIKNSAQVYESAAALGITDMYHNGKLWEYGGVVFIEESGANRVTEYGTNAKSVIFGRNAVIGYDDFMRPDLVRFYEDDLKDFGRSGKVGWKGIFGATRPVDGTANARSWVIYSSL